MEQARLTADKTALISKEKRLSYQELNKQTDTLASLLQAKGVKAASHIVIFLERSPEAIIAMLGTLKNGGVYVPIDISCPAGRISFILQDCNPAAVLTTRAAARHLPVSSTPLIFLDEVLEPADQTLENSFPEVSPEDPAYIIYTSGTTGTPKGVIVPHQGVVRLVFDQDYIDFGSEKTILQFASLAFDAATFEIWASLLHGGTCVIYPNDHSLDSAVLHQLISEQKISTLWLTTTLFNTLITTSPDCLRGVSEILVGGEALSPAHIRKAFKEFPRTKIINGYGPTENTTFTTCYSIPRDLPAEWTSIPIGKPLNHTTTYILNNDLKPVPIGDVGELYTGGTGLALGYLNHPELTAEKFIVNPDHNATDQRLYRTGDLVRQLPDGNLDYIGRIDDQVKIRGFRIELGEITSALLNHPNVKEAVVLVHTDDHQVKRIVAYLIFHGRQTPDKELRSCLIDFLPDYMLPACFIEVDRIPLNTNGKLDKKQLPPPSFATPGDYIAPNSKMEKQLAAIWGRLLNIKQISIVDNFFDIGGTSLLGIELIAIINNSLNLHKEIDAVALYQFPTIQAFANHLKPQDPMLSMPDAEKNRASRQQSAFSKFKKNRRS